MKYTLFAFSLLVCSFSSFAQSPVPGTHASPTGGCEGVESLNIQSINYDRAPVFVMATGKSYTVNVAVGSGIMDECTGYLGVSLVQGYQSHGIGSLAYAFSSYVDTVPVILTNILPGVYDLIAEYDTYRDTIKAVQKVSVIDVTGINQINETSGIITFPNPASDVLHIDNKNTGQPITAITLIGLDGRRVKTIQSLPGNAISIDVHDLPSGMYILQMTTATNTAYNKIMIQH